MIRRHHALRTAEEYVLGRALVDFFDDAHCDRGADKLGSDADTLLEKIDAMICELERVRKIVRFYKEDVLLENPDEKNEVDQ